MNGFNYADPTQLKKDLAQAAYDTLMAATSNSTKFSCLDPACETNGHLIGLKLMSINTYNAIIALRLAGGELIADIIADLEPCGC